MVGLGGFVFIYIALTLWFAWSAYFILTSEMEDGFIDIVKAFGCALIAIFFIKNLFFRKHSSESKDYEIKREQEPQLFEFLDRLAAETKAPRPRKVFLSGEVNACVFYDLSILNFFIPGRKNLMIGLGLVNSLSVTEFKAVLAHEFGHFAQSSMAVGRWVYVAQQVATQLIYHRDWFDELLAGISRFDFRIAWVGWVLRIVVWALRSILDTLLNIVMLAHRALSREMEYQADLVAVKNTGSDPIVNALHRLAPADDAWDETRSFVNEEIKRGFVPKDLFSIQTRILEHKRRILNDEEYGASPILPTSNPENHRVFTSDLAQPPQMWSTHPANHLREENAKRVYVQGTNDDRSAWCVFTSPVKLRLDFTQHEMGQFNKEIRPEEEAMKMVDKEYSKHFLNPDYRGTYLGRSIVSSINCPSQLYRDISPMRSELYPEWLSDHLEKHRNLDKENNLLQALRDGHFVPVDGVIRFRGNVIRRRELGSAIESVREDLNASEQILAEHDCKCRSYYLKLAHDQARGWPLYLQGLLALVHYADHSIRNLIDAFRLYQNTLSIVLADGSLSNSERARLLTDCNSLHRILVKLHSHAGQVILDPGTASHLEKSVWKDNFEEFRMPHAVNENLGEWVDAINGWVAEIAGCLGQLRIAALETLLDTEKQLERATNDDIQIGAAPTSPRLPDDYDILIEGQERDLQTKLNFWDSFQTATGVGPAIMRFVIAVSIVYGAVWLTVSEESISTLKITLGLAGK